MEIVDDDIIIRKPDDVFDYFFTNDCSTIILKKHNLANDFYDLSTGVAGEILQKFSTYRTRLAIIGDFDNVESKSLRDFIRESNKVRQIIFVKTVVEALDIFKK